MALTLTRWMSILVIGALIAVAVLLTPKRPTRATPRAAGWAEYERFRSADAFAGRAARRLRMYQVADSVVSSLGKLPKARASRSVFGKGLEPSLPFLRPVVDQMATRRPRAAVAPIEVAFVLLKPVRVQGHEVSARWNQATHVLPRTAAEPCVVIAQLGDAFASRAVMADENRWMRQRVSRLYQSAEVLGPCAFYESFGTPGPEIDRWLRAGAWRLGMAGTTSTPSEYRATLDSALRSPWSAWIEADLRRSFTTRGYRCMTGDAAVCATLVVDPRADARRPLDARVADNGVVETVALWSSYWIGGNLGEMQQAMFADMIRMLGRERFQRFWTSDKPPAEAFEAAFGKSIGAWTIEWSQDRYGVLGRGPAVSPSSAFVAALVGVLCLVGAIASARRQQVA